MKECISCKESMRQCMDTHTFAFAHLYNDEKAMDMHIHDCYESTTRFPAENSF